MSNMGIDNVEGGPKVLQPTKTVSTKYPLRNMCYCCPQTIVYKTKRFHTNILSDPCRRDPCQNNGACFRNEQDAFSCLCREGYTGDYCENRPPGLFELWESSFFRKS